MIVRQHKPNKKDELIRERQEFLAGQRTYDKLWNQYLAEPLGSARAFELLAELRGMKPDVSGDEGNNEKAASDFGSWIDGTS